MNNNVKYPRTPHLSYSQKLTSDDKKIKDEFIFENKNVIVLEKMDGENTSIEKNKVWARSLNSNANDEGRRWIDRIRLLQQDFLSNNYRICGENMFYKHTINYTELETAFYAFSIWTGEICHSWDITKSFLDEIGLKHPKIIYEGIYDKDKIMKSYQDIKNQREIEGFVVRDKDGFNLLQFPDYVVKFVDKDFIIDTTEKHWNSPRAKKEINNFVDSIWNITY